jgi:putative transposase
MSKKRWTRSKKCVFNIGYHLIWCPKYRRKILKGAIEVRLRELLSEKATELNIKIINMEIMPDHLHLFIKCEPTDSPHWIVQNFKGFSSRTLRLEFPELTTKMPCLWTRSYYCESVGHISEDTVIKYIADQKNK